MEGAQCAVRSAKVVTGPAGRRPPRPPATPHPGALRRRIHDVISSSCRWVEEPWRIVKHYATGWFLLDLISILPVEFLTLKPAGQSEVEVAEESESDLSALKLLRVIRLLRLIKLIRLVRGARILKRWESQVAINYSTLTLVMCLVFLLMSAHWFACVWALQARRAATRGPSPTVACHPRCRAAPRRVAAPQPPCSPTLAPHQSAARRSRWQPTRRWTAGWATTATAGRIPSTSSGTTAWRRALATRSASTLR